MLPIRFQAMIYAPPTVADLDGDGRYVRLAAKRGVLVF